MFSEQAVTLEEELVYLLTPQIIVHVYLKAQLAESAVELLSIPLSSIPLSQVYSVVKRGHRHHHSPVTLPPSIHGFSLLLQVSSESLTVSVRL